MVNKVIGFSALGAVLSTLVIIGLSQGLPFYYCEFSNIVMHCDNITSYYGLDNGKCFNSDLGNKVCSTGWLLIVDDTVKIETIEELLERQKLVNESFYDYDGCVDNTMAFCFYENNTNCDIGRCDAEQANFNENKQITLDSIRLSIEVLS